MLYSAAADLLAGAFGRILVPGAAGAAGHGRRLAVAARDRAGEALEQYLHERGAKPLAPEQAGTLVAAGAEAILAADLLDTLADSGYRAPAAGAADPALRGEVQALVAQYERLAERLHRAPDEVGRVAGVSPTVLRAAALDSLRRWREDPGAGRAAVAVVVAGEWIQQLSALAATVEAPVAEAAAAARVPWWR